VDRSDDFQKIYRSKVDLTDGFKKFVDQKCIVSMTLKKMWMGMERIDDFQNICGSEVDQTDDIKNVDQKWIGSMILKKSVDQE